MKVLAFLLLSSVSTLAAETSCPALFLSGSAPDVPQKLAARAYVQICYHDFSVGHSGISAGPLWSAEHLTRDGVYRAKAVPRVDAFYAEPALPQGERAELSDYRGSGFDRGHMAPSADMTTEAAQAESFTLANMVPQTAALNRKLWADIESTTRGLALSYGEAYVVTGPAFVGTTLRRIGGRVLVPTATFKAVYLPAAKAGSAWWATNDETGRSYEVISLAELRRRTGIDVFPALPDEVKNRTVGLPAPKAGSDAAADGARSKSASQPPSSQGTSHGWRSFLADVIGGMVRESLR